MPVDQLYFSMMAVLMLLAAAMGSSVMAGPMNGSSSPPAQRANVTQAPERSTMVDCQIVSIDIKDLELVVMAKDVETSYKLVPAVQVTKDGKAVELGSLAKGDYAVLTLATGGSLLVTRIEAVSSR